MKNLKNPYSGMVQNEKPFFTENQVIFDFQPVENDTVSVLFTNTIYPNPFHNTITVNSLEDEFILTSPTGNVVFQLIVHKGNNKIRIGDLSKGIYLGELINQRFITKLERL